MRSSTSWSSSARARRVAALAFATALPASLLVAGAGRSTAVPISGANLPNLSALPARAFAADHERLKMQVAVWNTKTYDIDYAVPLRISLLGADRHTVVRSRKVVVAPRSVFVRDRELADARSGASSAQQIGPGWGTRKNLNRFNGLALRLDRVDNGVYWVRTHLDPGHVLPEADTSDNVAYREISISGSGHDRRVAVLPG